MTPELPPIERRARRGCWHETQHGPVFVRDEWYPLDAPARRVCRSGARWVRQPRRCDAWSVADAPEPDAARVLRHRDDGALGRDGHVHRAGGRRDVRAHRRRRAARLPDAPVLPGGPGARTGDAGGAGGRPAPVSRASSRTTGARSTCRSCASRLTLARLPFAVRGDAALRPAAPGAAALPASHERLRTRGGGATAAAHRAPRGRSGRAHPVDVLRVPARGRAPRRCGRCFAITRRTCCRWRACSRAWRRSCRARSTTPRTWRRRAGGGRPRGAEIERATCIRRALALARGRARLELGGGTHARCCANARAQRDEAVPLWLRLFGDGDAPPGWSWRSTTNIERVTSPPPKRSRAHS